MQNRARFSPSTLRVVRMGRDVSFLWRPMGRRPNDRATIPARLARPARRGCHEDGSPSFAGSGMIAIDIDDCIAGYVSVCIERYGYPVVWSHSLREMWPLVDWDMHFETLNHQAFLVGMRPLAGAKEGCDLLSRSHDLLYLTASKESSASVRKLWLKIHDFPQAPMICTDGFD